MTKHYVSLAALAAFLACATPVFAQDVAAPLAQVPAAQSPSDVVRAFYTQLVEVMKHAHELGFAGRYKKLDPAVKQAFNLPLMTRVAVGFDWDQTTPAEQAQITQAFSQFSIANYAGRFAAYNGEQFRVVDEKPAVGGGTLVETELTPKGKDPVALNYIMKQDENGRWRIVDVLLNGSISELATRRAEFSAVIKRDGVAALVNSLGEKSKSMGRT